MLIYLLSSCAYSWKLYEIKMASWMKKPTIKLSILVVKVTIYCDSLLPCSPLRIAVFPIHLVTEFSYKHSRFHFLLHRTHSHVAAMFSLLSPALWRYKGNDWKLAAVSRNWHILNSRTTCLFQINTEYISYAVDGSSLFIAYYAVNNMGELQNFTQAQVPLKYEGQT